MAEIKPGLEPIPKLRGLLDTREVQEFPLASHLDVDVGPFVCVAEDAPELCSLTAPGSAL